MLSEQTSAQFVGSYPFNGSKAKELGAKGSIGPGPDPQGKSGTAASVNGWGGSYGSYYPNGCPHCGYCPTCGRSNGYPYYPSYPIYMNGVQSQSRHVH